MGVSASADMEKFSDRLKEACRRAGVEWGQTAISQAIGVAKQTADRWMGEGQPSADVIFKVADKLNVDARWLATGERSNPATVAGLENAQAHELDLLARYRNADPRWQLSLRLMAALATEDQIEFAADVNVIIARLLGKKPGELRYPSDAKVKAFVGPLPTERRPSVGKRLADTAARNKAEGSNVKEKRR